MNINETFAGFSASQNSQLCVGLDTIEPKIPEVITGPDRMFQFNREIIRATHDLVIAYKPNLAFYLDQGSEGVRQLELTCEYLHEEYPQIPIILDAKWADIGNTNKPYTRFAFDRLDVDAVTLHPGLGQEALRPFLDYEDRGCIILCRTSNKGAGEFQDLEVNGKPLYLVIAQHVVDEWNTKDNCMLVVGATYPEELAHVRKVAGDMTFLIPGIGTQGGDIEATVRAGINRKGMGMVINSSSGVIYAGKGPDFADAARKEAMRLRDAINAVRTSISSA